MDILVCVKQVPDDSVEIYLNPGTMKPDLSKASPQANAFDTYALEMAVRYCEAHGGTVDVVSFGPKANETSLRSCLSVGAKNAFLISDEGLEDADPSVTAAVLAAAVPKIEEALGTKFGLIMVGKESTDYIDGVVGPMMAEKLGLPFPYSYETALDLTDKTRMKRIMKENGIPTAEYIEAGREFFTDENDSDNK